MFCHLAETTGTKRCRYCAANRVEIRRAVSKGLNLKFAPEVRFEIDETFDRMDATRRLFGQDDVQRDLGADDDDA